METRVEIWRPVPNFLYYEVSNFGRVRNVMSGRIMMLHKTKAGYITVQLRNETISYTRRVHRLVAEAFLDLPDNYKKLDVYHRDNNRANNCADNLEWCTRKETVRRPFEDGRRHGPRRISVRIVETGAKHESLRACAIALGDERLQSAIGDCLRKPHYTIKGYHFEKV